MRQEREGTMPLVSLTKVNGRTWLPLMMKYLRAPPPTTHVEFSRMRVLGGGAFGRGSGRQGGSLIDGISILIKETPEGSPGLLPSAEDPARRWSPVLHASCSGTSQPPEP